VLPSSVITPSLRSPSAVSWSPSALTLLVSAAICSVICVFSRAASSPDCSSRASTLAEPEASASSTWRISVSRRPWISLFSATTRRWPSWLCSRSW